MPTCVRGMFARATRTSIGGLRSSIPPSQVPDPAIGWTCRFMMTLLAPIISKRRKDRSPIFVVAPSRCLPPVECCRGKRPSQATESRPRRKVSGGGARATKAVAINGPIPGIVISLRAISFFLARRLISALSLAIWSPRRIFVSIRTSSVARASSGKPLAGSSMIAIRRAAFAAPCGPPLQTPSGGREAH